MKLLLMIYVLPFVAHRVYSTEAIDHPIRHHHSERKTKPLQIFKNSTILRFSPKISPPKIASKSGAKTIVSDEEKSAFGSLEAEASRLMDDKSDVRAEFDAVKPFLRFNLTSISPLSAIPNRSLSDQVYIKDFQKVYNRLSASPVTKRDLPQRTNLFKITDLEKSGSYPLVFEDYQSDSPVAKKDQHSEFTRHNITVESPNQEDNGEQETFLRPDQLNKVKIKSEDSQWSLSLPEVSSKHNLNNTSTRILAPVGGDALLPCRVGHLGDRQVSWIRRRDWFVLTSGDSMYAHNERFLVLHEAGSQDWTLHIKRAVKGDSGMYECQVSTGTGIISFFVKLEVVIPTAQIPGNGRSHVFKGSPFTIFCYIMKSPSAMQHVTWFHNGDPLNYQRERQDFKITTRLQKKEGKDDESEEEYEDEEMENEFNNNIDKNVVISRLKVPFAKEEHSGNYSCSGQNIQPASTLIYVTEGDKTAAVQRIDSASSIFLSPQLFILVMMITLSIAK